MREHPFSISDANWQRLRCAPWQERYRESVLREFERGYKMGDRLLRPARVIIAGPGSTGKA